MFYYETYQTRDILGWKFRLYSYPISWQGVDPPRNSIFNFIKIVTLSDDHRASMYYRWKRILKYCLKLMLDVLMNYNTYTWCGCIVKVGWIDIIRLLHLPATGSFTFCLLSNCVFSLAFRSSKLQSSTSSVSLSMPIFHRCMIQPLQYCL